MDPGLTVPTWHSHVASAKCIFSTQAWRVQGRAHARDIPGATASHASSCTEAQELIQQLDEFGLDDGLVEAQTGEHARAVLQLQQRQQDVLGADVVVAEPQRLAEGQLEGLLAPARRTGSGRAPRRPAAGSAAVDGLADRVQRDALRDDRAWRPGRRARSSRPRTRCPGAISALPAARASSCERDHHVAGPRGERGEALAGVQRGRRVGPWATNRFWAACLVTPMLRPISVQEAPERRAWSTKWPIRWSATSPRWSAASTASVSWSRASRVGFLMASMRSSRRTRSVVMRQP